MTRKIALVEVSEFLNYDMRAFCHVTIFCVGSVKMKTADGMYAYLSVLRMKMMWKLSIYALKIKLNIKTSPTSR
jgi:hypothetical protein